jgi:hypothetical protein
MHKLLLILFVLAISFAGCKKKEIPGPQGDPGAPGIGGNSNMSSQSFVIAASQWTTDIDSSLWKASVNSTLITKDIVDKGSVKIFIQVNNTWWELPYTNSDLFMQFGFTEGVAHLLYSDIHGGKTDRPATANYRLVTFSEL